MEHLRRADRCSNRRFCKYASFVRGFGRLAQAAPPWIETNSIGATPSAGSGTTSRRSSAAYTTDAAPDRPRSARGAFVDRTFQRLDGGAQLIEGRAVRLVDLDRATVPMLPVVPDRAIRPPFAGLRSVPQGAQLAHHAFAAGRVLIVQHGLLAAFPGWEIAGCLGIFASDQQQGEEEY